MLTFGALELNQYAQINIAFFNNMFTCTTVEQK